MRNQSRQSTNGASIRSSTRRQVLRGGVGLGTAVVATPLLTGVAAAHFPVQLDIDIQPRNADNFIDLAEHDSVSVAVHPTQYLNGDGDHVTFDPTEEAVRYRFGSRFALEDGSGARPMGDGETIEVDSGHGDSHEALVLEFPVAETELDGGEETAWLYWERDESGEHGLSGVDSVRVYAADPSDRELFQMLRRLMNQRR